MRWVEGRRGGVRCRCCQKCKPIQVCGGRDLALPTTTSMSLRRMLPHVASGTSTNTHTVWGLAERTPNLRPGTHHTPACHLPWTLPAAASLLHPVTCPPYQPMSLPLPWQTPFPGRPPSQAPVQLQLASCTHLGCACDHVLHVISVTGAVHVRVVASLGGVLHCGRDQQPAGRQQASALWQTHCAVASAVLGAALPGISSTHHRPPPWEALMVMPRAFSSGACTMEPWHTHESAACTNCNWCCHMKRLGPHLVNLVIGH